MLDKSALGAGDDDDTFGPRMFAGGVLALICLALIPAILIEVLGTKGQFLKGVQGTLGAQG